MSNNDPAKGKNDLASNVGSLLIAIAFTGTIAASYLVNLFGIGAPRLEVVASAVETKQEICAKSDETKQEIGAISDGWIVRGKVLYQGSPVHLAKVWAIARDPQGNRYAPKTSVTDKFGGYELEPFPKVIGSVKDKEVTEVSVFAVASVKTKENGKEGGNETVKGEEQLGLGGAGRTRWIQLPPTALVAIPTIFFASIILGLFRFSQGSRWLRAQYFGSAALGIIFTITMIGYISAGLYMVNASASPGDALSLGFATIFQGTYVENVDPEWLFSLTAPGPLSKSIVTGMGAPLWVLLLSVFGSGVFTVSLVVSHINKDLKLEDPLKVRELVEEIVKHQFYVFFSPLGAVIVYQLLVLAGAASQAVTVGISAIAAGVALNAILNKAIATVKQLIK